MKLKAPQHSPWLVNALVIALIAGFLAWVLIGTVAEVVSDQQQIMASDMHNDARTAIQETGEDFVAFMQNIASLVLGGFIGVVGTLATQRTRRNGNGKTPPDADTKAVDGLEQQVNRLEGKPVAPNASMR